MQDVAARSASRKVMLWDDYVKLGLERLHPIIPPGARPSSRWLNLKTTPDPRQNGRCLTPERALAFWSAKVAVGKLPGFWWDDGWAPRNVQGDEARLRGVYDPRRLGGYRWAVLEKGGGIGVSGSELLGLDIDVVDPGACKRVVELVEGLVGLAPGYVFRVGRAPKLLVPFRLRAGAPAFAKPTRLELGPTGAVEWLTTGQQWVLEGMHGGTGKPYGWPAGRLWEAAGGLAGLPTVDEDEAIGLLRTLGKALGLGSRGVGIKRGRLPEARVAVSAAAAQAARAAEVAGLMCAEADARAMVDAVPNLLPAIDERGTPREDYVGMAHHLLGCSGGAAWGRELFLEWAAKYPEDHPEYNENVWDGLSEPRTGWPSLMHLAEKHGWPGGLALRGRQAARAFRQLDKREDGGKQ